GSGIVDHDRLGLKALQEMRGGDVGHVERRVLAKMDHVELRKINGAGVCEPVVIAGAVLDREAMALREQPAVDQRKISRRVIEHVMPAPLRLEQEREGRIAPDIDALDGVHLEGDLECHGAPYRRSRGSCAISLMSLRTPRDGCGSQSCSPSAPGT